MNSKPSRAKTKATQPPTAPVKHAILVLHGAGSPPDQKTFMGDPLAIIANGLLDFFQRDEPWRTRARIAVKAGVDGEKRVIKQVTLDIFEKAETEKHAFTIQMAEALWKPTMPPRGLWDYVPLLWLWAFTFYSQTSRKIQARRIGARNQETEEQSAQRRRGEFISRVYLALLGFLSSLAWVLGARAMVRGFNLNLSPEVRAFLTTWAVPVVVSISFVTMLLLILLAREEYRKRAKEQTLSTLHLVSIIISTAWLGLYLTPFLLLAYYFEHVISIALVALIVVLPILVPLSLGFGWAALGLLTAFAFSIWLLSRQTYKRATRRAANILRENMQSTWANWITTLLVAAGAPIAIFLISVLELLAALPFFGAKVQQTAKGILEAGFWEIIKDIHMFLIDSSRAAVARAIVERGIRDLDAADVSAIHVFSHSLDTVVAYDTLVHLGRDAGALIRKNDATHKKMRTLLTYGSPLNKIRILAKKAKTTGEADPEIMAGFDYQRFDETARLPEDKTGFKWLNFFAAQDIVSDMLTHYQAAPPAQPDDPTLPHDYNIPSATDIFSAHDSYWHDDDFWRTTLAALGITLAK